MPGLVRGTFTSFDETTVTRMYVRNDDPSTSGIWQIQKRLTKLIPKLKYLPYKDRLRSLALPLLEYRRRRRDMSQVFKVMNDIDRVRPSTFFGMKVESSTRGDDDQKSRKRLLEDIEQEESILESEDIDLTTGHFEEVSVHEESVSVDQHLQAIVESSNKDRQTDIAGYPVPETIVLKFAPTDFKTKFLTTQAIFDGTECPIKKPQATFSTYKNKNTVKVLVGVTPAGLVSYVSPAYGGSASDRQIVERSNLTQMVDQEITLNLSSGQQRAKNGRTVVDPEVSRRNCSPAMQKNACRSLNGLDLLLNDADN
ncbi:hypothetical protein LSH36_324g03017 [Paralvinella palmiformis]|uniref:DDE Tnp4 domain-containing protein n=1 Tax=Paralvinella palmiformis TaxID=53620 RepID=A0AAD9JGQ0_9ANNE|nr:hypothetical protein LSH36_324g03017 [Paralvinella palmiformis]